MLDNVIECRNLTMCIIKDAEGNYLMQKRTNEPNMGSWSFVSGSVGFEENISEAVQRRVHEETGLTVKEVKLRATLTFYDKINGEPDNIRTMFIYVTNKFTGNIKAEGSDGMLEWKNEFFISTDEWIVDFIPILINELEETNEVISGMFVYELTTGGLESYNFEY